MSSYRFEYSTNMVYQTIYVIPNNQVQRAGTNYTSIAQRRRQKARTIPLDLQPLSHHTYDNRSGASVHNLPPEILGMVFNWTADMDMHLIHPTRAPLLFTRVCKKWRDVAHSTPQLWDTLWVGDVGGHRISESWIKRSGNVPLSLGLSFDYECLRDGEVSEEDLPPLMECLRNNHHRIRDLNLNLFDAPTSIQQFLPIKQPVRMESLEGLTIRASRDFLQQWGGIIAPRLRNLSMQISCDRIDQLQRILPCSLTTLSHIQLTMIEASAADVCDVLTACPALTKCLLNFVDLQYPEPTKIVSLPHLTTLALKHMMPDDPAEGLLRNLYTPNLQTFELKFTELPIPPPDQVDFWSFFISIDLANTFSNANSLMHLTRLTLIQVNFAASTWKPFFKAAKNLKKLTADSCVAPESVLQELLKEDTLCPLLKIADFRTCYAMVTSADSWIDGRQLASTPEIMYYKLFPLLDGISKRRGMDFKADWTLGSYSVTK